MSIEVERATIACGCCGAKVTELRRGRCWGCYSKWAEMRPVPKGAACAVCDERRRENLRLVELHSRSVALCHICAARTMKLAKVPGSIDGLRRQLLRDRRQDNRRGDGMERRIFPRERRVGDRLGPPRASASDTTNPGFVMPEFEDIVIEIQDADIEIVEQTLVRERPVASALGRRAKD
jgi:hypothetical protein